MAYNESTVIASLNKQRPSNNARWLKHQRKKIRNCGHTRALMWFHAHLSTERPVYPGSQDATLVVGGANGRRRDCVRVAGCGVGSGLIASWPRSISALRTALVVFFVSLSQINARDLFLLVFLLLFLLLVFFIAVVLVLLLCCVFGVGSSSSA